MTKRDLSKPLASTYGEDDPKKGKGKTSETRDYTYNYNAAKEKGGDVGVAMRDKQKGFLKEYKRGDWSQDQLRDSIATTLNPKFSKDKSQLNDAATAKMRKLGVMKPIAEATYMARKKAKKVGVETGRAVEAVVQKVTAKGMQGCPPKSGQNSGGTKGCK
jgi:hypothetical protein